jgi:hypothetical protein
MRALGLVLLSLSGCVVNQRPVEQPRTDQAVVLVGSAALPEPIDGLARHPWVALREPGASHWERWEVMCCDRDTPLGTVRRTNIDPLSDHGGGGGDVRVHGLFTGERAEPMIACVRREGPRYPDRHLYRAWPGPNSNTFVDYIARKCAIPVDLPSPSIGKDYRGLVLGASSTAGGTGVQLETPLIGTKLGLTEGVELHLFGMAWGVDLWPPALIVPFGPGRFGFDDR